MYYFNAATYKENTYYFEWEGNEKPRDFFFLKWLVDLGTQKCIWTSYSLVPAPDFGWDLKIPVGKGLCLQPSVLGNNHLLQKETVKP